MLLEHEFVVPVPVAQAWDVLLDVERIAPCMPGATVESFDGETVHGKVKVKVGPIQVTYAGTATFTDKDETARTVTIEATGKEARGSGTAKASITAGLHAEGGSTRVTVTTDLAITGKPAQFGRGVMVEVGNKLLGRFADCLAEEITSGGAGSAQPTGAASGGTDGVAPGTASAAGAAGAAASSAPAMTAAPSKPTAPTSAEPPAPATPAVRPVSPIPRPAGNDTIDLLEVGGSAVAKRVLPLVAGLVVLFLLWRLLRRR